MEGISDILKRNGTLKFFERVICPGNFSGSWASRIKNTIDTSNIGIEGKSRLYKNSPTIAKYRIHEHLGKTSH